MAKRNTKQVTAKSKQKKVVRGGKDKGAKKPAPSPIIQLAEGKFSFLFEESAIGNTPIRQLNISHKMWPTVEKILSLGVDALAKEQKVETKAAFGEAPSKIEANYQRLDSFTCFEEGCNEKAVFIKNIYRNGIYLGFVSYCPEHKKKSQISDIEKGVKIVEQ